MLERVVHRTRLANLVDEIVLAIPDTEADQKLLQFIHSKGWNVVCGNEHDVLSRYLQAAKQYSADAVVRITSDCPLIDPEIVDQVIQKRLEQGADYASNFHPNRHYPRGLDCEVFSRKTLERVDRLAKLPHYREHVTYRIYDTKNIEKNEFQTTSTCSPKDYSDYRWTVDTIDDLELVKSIYNYFDNQSNFRWKEILKAYQFNPGWKKINRGIKQKAA